MISNTSNNISAGAAEVHKEKNKNIFDRENFFDKVTDSFESAKASINNFCTVFEERPIRAKDIYQGDRYTLTLNRGKNKDKAAYADLEKNPGRPTENQKAVLHSHGFDSADLTIKPEFVGGGKCSGGTTHFLNLVLNNASKQELIDTFKDGVPLNAVLNQEIYLQIFEVPTKPTIQDKLESTVSAIGNFFSFSKASESEQKEIAEDPTSGLEKNELVLLGVNNLVVEKSIMDFQKSNELKITSFEQQADYIVDQIPNLAPGAYKLTVPNHGRLGAVEARHTIGFIKKENSTIFYDANFAITEVNNQNNQETVKRVLRLYTGYSATATEKITNAWHGKPNMPVPGVEWEVMELIKVKLKDS